MGEPCRECPKWNLWACWQLCLCDENLTKLTHPYRILRLGLLHALVYDNQTEEFNYTRLHVWLYGMVKLSQSARFLRTPDPAHSSNLYCAYILLHAVVLAQSLRFLMVRKTTKKLRHDIIATIIMTQIASVMETWSHALPWHARNNIPSVPLLIIK